jgi:hypothetical protein
VRDSAPSASSPIDVGKQIRRQSLLIRRLVRAVQPGPVEAFAQVEYLGRLQRAGGVRPRGYTMGTRRTAEHHQLGKRPACDVREWRLTWLAATTTRGAKRGNVRPWPHEPARAVGHGTGKGLGASLDAEPEALPSVIPPAAVTWSSSRRVTVVGAADQHGSVAPTTRHFLSAVRRITPFFFPASRSML